jgi:hypothetical protein
LQQQPESERAVLLGGLRRIAVIWISTVVVTAGVAALIGLASHSHVLRAMAVGLYIVAAFLLLGCFVMGARGPLRGVGTHGETTGVLGARGIRRATLEERSDATRLSLLLFGLALATIVLAALIDPAHPLI